MCESEERCSRVLDNFSVGILCLGDAIFATVHAALWLFLLRMVSVATSAPIQVLQSSSQKRDNGIDMSQTSRFCISIW